MAWRSARYVLPHLALAVGGGLVFREVHVAVLGPDGRLLPGDRGDRVLELLVLALLLFALLSHPFLGGLVLAVVVLLSCFFLSFCWRREISASRSAQSWSCDCRLKSSSACSARVLWPGGLALSSASAARWFSSWSACCWTCSSWISASSRDRIAWSPFAASTARWASRTAISA